MTRGAVLAANRGASSSARADAMPADVGEEWKEAEAAHATRGGREKMGAEGTRIVLSCSSLSLLSLHTPAIRSRTRAPAAAPPKTRPAPPDSLTVTYTEMTPVPTAADLGAAAAMACAAVASSWR
jgi:hypothetical protein